MSDEKRSMFSYFKLKDAVDDVSHALDNKDKAVAGAKLVGKTLFNVGVFAGKMGAEMIKELPSQNIKIAEKAGSLGIPVEATRCSVSLMPVASLKMPDPPECVGRNASHPTTHSSGA
ncbi:hypothetical protein [Thiothrix lacustris]|uniref:hypothetical protein n=1 Tax=Thiothrix lacustris TaxID=525917 RepID=UPI0027E4C9E5|nr:hypothetical protein [Thiothrix lacustris]WMP18360.1 hypothetical protein RCS87_04705 [Thiothrix lacustris]